MRKALLASGPIALAACATTSAPTIPVHGETPGRICNAAGGEPFVGQPATSEVGAEILRATNSERLRWAPPGAMMTMGFSPSRVTVRLDGNNRVTQISCG